MRNGNKARLSAPASATFFVLILPMRNGNRVQKRGREMEVLRSYPTYEEWKQIKLINIMC